MKNKVIIPILISFLLFTSCEKEDKKSNRKRDSLVAYSITDIENAAVQNAKCGIDLTNGKLYSVIEGQSHQNDVDIAYGYMNRNSRFERVFLDIDYAGCFCGGSSYFSYGDQPGRLGYSSYSVRNKTKLMLADTVVDFDGISNSKNAAVLRDKFPANFDVAASDEAQLSVNDNFPDYPYVFFETIDGKRGIIRLNPYVKNTSTGYELDPNPIDIDIIVEL